MNRVIGIDISAKGVTAVRLDKDGKLIKSASAATLQKVLAKL